MGSCRKKPVLSFFVQILIQDSEGQNLWYLCTKIQVGTFMLKSNRDTGAKGTEI